MGVNGEALQLHAIYYFLLQVTREPVSVLEELVLISRGMQTIYSSMWLVYRGMQTIYRQYVAGIQRYADNMWVVYSLVPRPCPAFCRLQYGKAGESLVHFLM